MVSVRDKVWKQITENDVKFVKLWFTDILGFLKSFSIPVEELEKALDLLTELAIERVRPGG